MTGSRTSNMLQCNLSCNVLIFPCEINWYEHLCCSLLWLFL